MKKRNPKFVGTEPERRVPLIWWLIRNVPGQSRSRNVMPFSAKVVAGHHTDPGSMTNKRFCLYIILIIILAVHVYADTADASDPSANPLYMWHTSYGDAEMYMLGSIHILTEDFYPLPDVIENLSYRADLLVLEADIREETAMPEEIVRLTFLHGFYHDGSGLEDHLSEDLHEVLQKALIKNGLSMAQVALMKPWLLAFTLQILELDASGYKAEYGMEQVLTKRHAGGELIELEGAEYQLKLLSGLSGEEQIELLKSVLEESGRMTDYLERFIDAWKSGNPGLLADELDSDGDGVAEDIAERLIITRNVAMAARAGELLHDFEGTILLVVGAAHFIGESGIPSLMSNQGFEVSQVMADGGLTSIMP